MTNEQLPPLPEYADAFRSRWAGDQGGFTADQMRDYARAALAAKVPADHVSVPLSLLEDASSAIGHFVSDHGWGDEDMQAMDNLDAYIARHKALAPAPAPEAGPEAQQPMPEPDVAEAVFDYYQHFSDPQNAAEAHFGKDLAIFRLAERACAEAWGVKLGASGEK